MQTIYLDISNKGVIPVIYAKQGDVGRKVEVVLTNAGLPYEPEAGSAFSAWFSGASGMGNYTDIGERSAFSVSGNKVTVELITQMLQNAGEGILCLVLSRANDDQIGLWNVRYICEDVPGAGSGPAKDYYTAFSKAVADLPYPDVSLSVAGKAADAAATGKALAGKAPAQEDASFPGCYYRMINGIKEWVNPPMIPGVEYRTTERWNGKVVYAKAVNAGALTNGAHASFTEAHLYGGIRVCATAEGYVAPFYSGGTLVFAASAEPSTEGVRVTFYSNGWLDGKDVTVCLWYTKD